MVEVKWTIQAIDDIDNIAEYIAKDSIRYAKIQTERFFDATDARSGNKKNQIFVN